MNDFIKLFITGTLGESILVETLRSAAYFITHSDMRTHHPSTKKIINDAKNCYYFIQGTNLDILIYRYDLAYDPEILREQFNYLVRSSN